MKFVQVVCSHFGAQRAAAQRARIIPSLPLRHFPHPFFCNQISNGSFILPFFNCLPLAIFAIRPTVVTLFRRHY
jgi:hypothetical protein